MYNLWLFDIKWNRCWASLYDLASNQLLTTMLALSPSSPVFFKCACFGVSLQVHNFTCRINFEVRSISWLLSGQRRISSNLNLRMTFFSGIRWDSHWIGIVNFTLNHGIGMVQDKKFTGADGSEIIYEGEKNGQMRRHFYCSWHPKWELYGRWCHFEWEQGQQDRSMSCFHKKHDFFYSAFEETGQDLLTVGFDESETPLPCHLLLWIESCCISSCLFCTIKGRTWCHFCPFVFGLVVWFHSFWHSFIKAEVRGQGHCNANAFISSLNYWKNKMGGSVQ